MCSQKYIRVYRVYIYIQDTRTHLQGTALALALGNTLRDTAELSEKFIWRKWKVKDPKKAEKTFTAQPSKQTDDCQGSSDSRRIDKRQSEYNRTRIGSRDNDKEKKVIASYFQFPPAFSIAVRVCAAVRVCDCVCACLGEILLESKLIVDSHCNRTCDPVHPHPVRKFLKSLYYVFSFCLDIFFFSVLLRCQTKFRKALWCNKLQCGQCTYG